MHNLKGPSNAPLFFSKGKGRRVESGGSRFTVTRHNAVTVGKTYSRTSTWCAMYTDNVARRKPA